MNNPQIAWGRVAAILDEELELHAMLTKCCKAIVECFECCSARISLGEDVCEENKTSCTEHRCSFHTEMPDGDELSLELFFLDGKSCEQLASDENVKILLNMIAGAVSKLQLARLLHVNTERVKELSGINKTSALLEATPLEESLDEICQFLTEAWQYPADTVVRIVYEDKIFTTHNRFHETQWVQRESFYMPNGTHGTIEVFYLKKYPQADEGPFLKEERNLLVNITHLISGSASKDMFRKLHVENSERLKELNGINQTASIIGREVSIRETLQKICNTIPKSWQYPMDTCVRVVYEDAVFSSRGFKESAWFIKENFVTLDNKKGSIQVFYTKKHPEAYYGPFLKEECRLLSNISRLVCGYINNYKGREVYNKVTRLVDVRKSEDFRKTLVKDRNPLQLFFNKQVLDKYIYLDMMQYKVKNILFVATLYDAFILESEDSFFEWFMGEIYQYGLFSVPRITGVSSSQEAMDVLKTMHFDLVILMVGIDKTVPIELSRNIKRKYRKLPVYLLMNQKSDTKYFEELVPNTSSIDKLFVWNGNSQIFFSIVKSIEDAANVENDTHIGLVRVILLIEDSAQYYSRYLQYLYSIVFEQIQNSLSDAERNEINKISKIRSRPKILHARNYEDAMFIYEKYKDFLLCVVSDVEFDRNGSLDKEAGFRFVKHVKKQAMALPILLQSSDINNKSIAEQFGATFIDKNSDTLFADLKNFLISQLGFGNFVFRDKNGNPLAEARTLKEFQSILKYISEDSLYTQAVENQFSLWLMSRGEIQLAKTINPIRVSDFDTIEDFRQSFLQAINTYKDEKRRGKILNYEEVTEADDKNIVSFSGGSLGGKGRGLAFINTLIYNLDFSRYSADINVRMPITAIIGTNEFDRFMEENQLYRLVGNENVSYMELRRHFVAAQLSDALLTKLVRFLSQIESPLAVRSSSLSEDSINQPFAGVFDTYVVPNIRNHRCELEQISTAIKLVYASIYSDESRHYFDAIHRKVEEEKMAVILQELVGSEHENYYYPHISGTAQSYNYYPVAHMQPEEGFAMAAMGLGYYVVGGQKSFRFSPRYPNIDIFTPKDMIRSTQTEFCVLDLNRTDIDYVQNGESAPLTMLPISEAEKHGTIAHCVSVFNAQNDSIESGLSCYGPRIINFADILKYDYVPLAQLLDELLGIAQGALGSPVELEWAVDLTKKENGLPTFYLLQIKPMVAESGDETVELEKPQKEKSLLYTENSLGNGEISSISDIIFVDPDKFDKMKTLGMVKEIEYLNNLMVKENRQYLLIGPGRWGTRDQFLGIPVTWPQISNAKIIVEMSLPDFPLDSSLGSHFFHNVTSMNIGYFSIQSTSSSEFINWDFIHDQKVKNETDFFKHIRLKKPLKIKMDGKKRKALVLL